IATLSQAALLQSLDHETGSAEMRTTGAKRAGVRQAPAVMRRMCNGRAKARPCERDHVNRNRDYGPACVLSAARSASLRKVITAILLTRYSGMTTFILPSCSSIETWRTSVPREGRSKVVHLLAAGSYLRTTSDVHTFIQRLWFLSTVIW